MPVNNPRSRDSTSAVYQNHSQFTINLSSIYKSCHSIKSINRPLPSHEGVIPSERKRSKREIRDRSCLLAHPRPPPGVSPDHHLTLDFYRTIA
ncbi:hypothetical protein KFK09_001368 [Dendrobium nobile]|uniref:Uncharacterized protein n=1 Tax=Dendrobium nobile TaxID=94219 RepID=A0A8T3CAP0_DENNO|nr:hypothetical protein KFK09_001368 [Dendrobium nobile]